jgi:hypothetical protein
MCNAAKAENEKLLAKRFFRCCFVKILGLGNIFSSLFLTHSVAWAKKNERIECMLWSENWNVKQ